MTPTRSDAATAARAALQEQQAPGDGLAARRILVLVGDKWTTVVLYCLSLAEVRRFNELQRRIPEISKKMLIQTLRHLERDGLLERTVYAEVPPRTDYRLTPEGHRLREPIAALCRWALDNEALINGIMERRAADNDRARAATQRPFSSTAIKKSPR